VSGPRRALGALGAGLAGVTAYDLLQRRHAVLRNFPVIGHLRYLLETFGPELRQYIVTSNDEERPFSRDQRRWVYASAKRETSTFGFGSDNEMEAVESLLVIKHAAFPATTGRAAFPTTRSRSARCSAARAAAGSRFARRLS
jgi:glutamate synthase domain-containing protein 2